MALNDPKRQMQSEGTSGRQSNGHQGPHTISSQGGPAPLATKVPRRPREVAAHRPQEQPNTFQSKLDLDAMPLVASYHHAILPPQNAKLPVHNMQCYRLSRTSGSEKHLDAGTPTELPPQRYFVGMHASTRRRNSAYTFCTFWPFTLNLVSFLNTNPHSSPYQFAYEERISMSSRVQSIIASMVSVETDAGIDVVTNSLDSFCSKAKPSASSGSAVRVKQAGSLGSEHFWSQDTAGLSGFGLGE